MGKSCVWSPGINRDLSGKSSKLYKDLLGYTGDREVANTVHAAIKTPEYMGKLKGMHELEYDENGEPTLDSLLKVIDIDGMVDKSQHIKEKKEVGAIDNRKNPKQYDRFGDAVQRIVQFNNKHKDLVAYVVARNGKYEIEVGERTAENEQLTKETIFNNSLNNTLRGILQKLGFDVEIDGTDTRFDPTNARKTAEGLKIVIRVAKGQENEQHFPEEFSHVIIEGLQGNTLVTRIMRLCSSEEVQREILGNEYNSYINAYTDSEGNLDTLRMTKEVAGRVLQSAILKEYNSDLSVNPLFSRLWDKARGMYSAAETTEVDNAILKAMEDAEQIAKGVKDESLLPKINTENVLNAKVLHHLSTTTTTIQEKWSKKAFELEARKTRLAQQARKSGTYTSQELRRLRRLDKAIEEGNHLVACAQVVSTATKELQAIQTKLHEHQGKDFMQYSMSQLATVAKLLNDIMTYKSGYEEFINELRRIDIYKDNPDFGPIAGVSLKVFKEEVIALSNLMNDLEGVYRELQKAALMSFYSKFWGSVEKVWDVGEKKGEIMTLDKVMELADRDIGFLNRWISSMADSTDPLLALTDKAVKTSMAERDAILEQLLVEIRGIHKKFKKTGGDPTFMYERDENGIPTGMIISNIDYSQFYKDRREYKEKLKSEGKKYWVIQEKLRQWDIDHTEVVKIPTNDQEDREERIPIHTKSARDGKIYRKDPSNNTMYPSGLSAAQREYYDAMMEIKSQLDGLLPNNMVSIHRAVQIRNSTVGALTSNNPAEAMAMLKSSIADHFTRRIDEVDYGEIAENEEGDGIAESEERPKKKSKKKNKNLLLDFSGEIMRKVPVMYTKRLEDMRRLSTDFTSSILAYAAASVNYHEMSKVVDILELGRNYIHYREVQQYNGVDAVVDTLKVLHKDLSQAHLKRGGRIAERYDDYLEMNVYSRRKVDEGTVTIFGKRINVTKTLDALKDYTGAVGLGLNVFSGLSNVTMGKMQMFIDACSGEYFDHKNAMIGKKNYYLNLIPILAECNSTSKSNKVGLLIEKFDALEDFYRSLHEQGKFTGTIKRAMEGNTLMILNNLGEHYLRTKTMLAMLDRQKVHINGEEHSLYDAYESQIITDASGEPISTKLVLKDGTTETDGTLLFTESMEKELQDLISKRDKTQDDKERIKELQEISSRTIKKVIDLKMKIARVNQTMHGAFNEVDRGAINRYALGRLALQFRQWMPKHYQRRFGKARWDFILDEATEGYYRTAFRVITTNLYKDVIKSKKTLREYGKSLSNKEKAAFRRVGAEVSTFVLLSILLSMMGDTKDHKGNWGMRMLQYNLYRMKLEAGVSIPWTSLLENGLTIIKSPAAAVNSTDGLLNLLEFWNLWETIDSGRYKGMTVYERDLNRAVPVYPQLQKLVDIGDEDYMFNLFK